MIYPKSYGFYKKKKKKIIYYRIGPAFCSESKNCFQQIGLQTAIDLCTYNADLICHLL